MDVMAPFTCFITSLLHVEETELTLWSDKIRKSGEGGWEGGGRRRRGRRAFWGNIFFFFLFPYFILSHSVFFLSFYLFPLYLSPGSFHLMICRTHIVYSVFRLNFIGKKHTSEHRFNARTRVWNTPQKSSCTGLLKFTRKTRHSKHWDTLARKHTHTHTHIHAQLCTSWMGYILTSRRIYTNTHTHTRHIHMHAHTRTEWLTCNIKEETNLSGPPIPNLIP